MEDVPRPTEEEIRQLAYVLSKSSPEKTPEENWYEAERELMLAVKTSVLTHP
ncbi:MAG: hypothetical protein JOY73_09080 [Actinobacteria bacterium]|nr:hypothetical protein [Actinomycetota bacterium]